MGTQKTLLNQGRRLQLTGETLLVGRVDYGTTMFPGETDARGLDYYGDPEYRSDGVNQS